MQPLETLYLESTTKPTTERLDSLVDLQLQEIPSHLDIFETNIEQNNLFSHVSSMVYVIDSQDEYLMALQSIVQVIQQAYRVNPKIHFEVLIHKVDGLNEDFRQDTQRDIIQRITDELVDAGIADADLSFYMTSIFDHSIIEAFSRIVQKLVPEISTLTQLLDLYCVKSEIEKAFLFDAGSKLYLATDSSPVDVETYQVCSDFIDVALDLGNLYKDDNLGKPLASTSKLQNGVVIHLNQMIKGVLLVGLSRGESPQKGVFIDYNAQVLRECLHRMYN